MLVRTPLGEAALTYIRDAISYDTPLDRMLSQLALDQGEVFSFLPKHVDPIALTTFHAYTFWSVSEQNASESLAEDLVIKFLSIEPNCSAIFEDPMGRLPLTSTHFSQLLFDGIGLYYYCTSKSTPKEIRTMMQVTLGNWRAIGVCFAPKISIDFHSGEKIADGTYETIFDSIKMLYIGAYDEGSWLIWTPFSDT